MLRLLDFYRVCGAYRTRAIPMQSRVRLGVFSKNPEKQPDAKELMAVIDIVEIMKLFD